MILFYLFIIYIYIMYAIYKKTRLNKKKNQKTVLSTYYLFCGFFSHLVNKIYWLSELGIAVCYE